MICAAIIGDATATVCSPLVDILATVHMFRADRLIACESRARNLKAALLQLYSGDYTAIDGLGVDFGNVNSGALLHGGGTSTYPLTNSVADKNFLSYYTKCTATSGTARGLRASRATWLMARL